MAHSDPLTGLANERTVARVLELELARAGRQGSEVSLAMFDIDDFQATNRDGGHAAGDDVLRRVAAVLAESVRLVDTVGRVGGDEFVLIAPGSAGLTVVNRVMDGIAALPGGGRARRLDLGGHRPLPGRRRRFRGAHRRGDRGPGPGAERGPRQRRRDRGGPEGLKRRPERASARSAGPQPVVGAVAVPESTIGSVGVVAPGPGSWVRPRTIPGSAGTPEPWKAPVPPVPTVKLPSGTGTPSAPTTQAS